MTKEQIDWLRNNYYQEISEDGSKELFTKIWTDFPGSSILSYEHAVDQVPEAKAALMAAFLSGEIQ